MLNWYRDKQEKRERLLIRSEKADQIHEILFKKIGYEISVAASQVSSVSKSSL